MVPGYKEKIWAQVPTGLKAHLVKSTHDKFEKHIATHKAWQGKFLSYKAFEKSFAPSAKYRKPSVDWRRQMERGTLFFGRWYEGPYGTDYRPGNTHDRLANVKAPFTEAEWKERKQYRSFDLLHIGYGILALFLAYRVTSEWPVVWCEETADSSDDATQK
jgi:ubiquinol-cytochrome c reductase cytochrome c1 subunit